MYIWNKEEKNNIEVEQHSSIAN